MSNRNWVCFECRKAVRREATVQNDVFCAHCGERCVNIGYKIPVPRREDVKSWESLRDSIRKEHYRVTAQNAQFKVERRHDLEREIAEIESRPENPGRNRLLRELKGRLERM